MAYVKLYFFVHTVSRKKLTKSVNTSDYQKSLNSKPVFWRHGAVIIGKEKFEAGILVFVKQSLIDFGMHSMCTSLFCFLSESSRTEKS